MLLSASSKLVLMVDTNLEVWYNVLSQKIIIYDDWYLLSGCGLMCLDKKRKTDAWVLPTSVAQVI